jgi:hypothetical protein
MSAPVIINQLAAAAILLKFFRTDHDFVLTLCALKASRGNGSPVAMKPPQWSS